MKKKLSDGREIDVPERVVQGAIEFDLPESFADIMAFECAMGMSLMDVVDRRDLPITDMGKTIHAMMGEQAPPFHDWCAQVNWNDVVPAYQVAVAALRISFFDTLDGNDFLASLQLPDSDTTQPAD